MAPLLHQSLVKFSNHYFLQITYHILNGQIAFLGCVSLNVFSIDHFVKMSCHACKKKMVLSYMDPCMTLWKWLVKIEQANDFPSLWTFSCVFKEWLWTNDFSQLGQGNGFSPVRILSCFFNSSSSLQDLLHFVEANSFSPIFIFSWLFKALLYENDINFLSRQLAFLLCGTFHAF